MASRAVAEFERVLGGDARPTMLAKSLACQAFETSLAKAEFSPEHGKLGSPSGAAQDRSLEHDAPWLVNGAKYKVIQTESAKAPFTTIGERDSRYHEPRFAEAKEHTAKIPAIAERVFREGHRIMTQKGFDSGRGLAEFAADAEHPEHAAWEYDLAVQHHDPARKWNRLHESKKAGGITAGGHQLVMHEGIDHALNQHEEGPSPSHINHIIEGTKGQLFGDASKHVADTVTKLTRAAQRHAFWGRVLTHLAEHPESQNPGAESLATHPDIREFSTKSYVLHHAAKHPGASFEELHKIVKPMADDDTTKNGTSRRPVLSIWKGARYGYTNAADLLEHHYANLAVGDGRALKHLGMRVGDDYITPAIRQRVDQHMKRFAPEHPSMTQPIPGDEEAQQAAVAHVLSAMGGSGVHAGAGDTLPVGAEPPRPPRRVSRKQS